MTYNYIEKLRDICHHELNKLYSLSSDVGAYERLQEELKYVNTENMALSFLIMERLADLAAKTGIHFLANGPIAGSFIAYLLKITGVNPLISHYLCSDCKYTEHIDTFLNTVDMPEKKMSLLRKHHAAIWAKYTFRILLLLQ